MKLRLIKMKSVKSTNDTAIRLLRKNQFKPTLITSANQRKGRFCEEQPTTPAHRTVQRLPLVAQGRQIDVRF